MEFAPLATQRIGEVLQARLADCIAQHAPNGLTLPEPAADDYHWPGQYVDKSLISSPIAVIVRQSDPMTTRAPQSGKGDEDCIIATLPVEVRVLFSEDVMGTLLSPLSARQLDRSEYYTRCAQAYAAAIIRALYESAQDGHIIDLIELQDQFPRSEQFREGHRAVARTNWRCITTVSRPLDTRYIQPGSTLITR